MGARDGVATEYLRGPGRLPAQKPTSPPLDPDTRSACGSPELRYVALAVPR